MTVELVPMILVFFGVKGSGKNTSARAIKERWPHYYEVAFADPIKRMIETAYPKIPREHLWGDTSLREIECTAYPLSGHCMTCGTKCVENCIEGRWWKCVRCQLTFPRYLTPRLAATSLGTEWGRRIYVDTWTEAGLELARKNGPSVITDGRFFTEQAACERSKTCLIYLTRGLEKSTDPHPSEAEPRTMGKLLAKGNYHFDIVLDNEHMGLEEANRTLIHEIEALSTRQVTRIDWTKYPTDQRSGERRTEGT